jgi:hypothetical protein
MNYIIGTWIWIFIIDPYNVIYIRNYLFRNLESLELELLLLNLKENNLETSFLKGGVMSRDPLNK